MFKLTHQQARVWHAQLRWLVSVVSIIALSHSPLSHTGVTLSTVPIHAQHTHTQLLESTSARGVLSSEEELVLLIAALCHDLDHDGFTNSFHIHSQSPLSQRYNDKSGAVRC